jgi:hypothetical protein
MGNKTITTEGRNFIINICTKTSVISGSMKWNMVDGPIRKNEIVNSNIIFNNNKITTGLQYANALIYWFELYGKEFNIDPNVLAAQAYEESSYRVFAYASTSTAMGLTQFTVPTIQDDIIKNKFGVFNDNEINKILKNTFPTTEGYDDEKTFNVIRGEDTNRSISNEDQANFALNNKRNLYQNVVDNPDIMIKAQAAFLRDNANKHNNLTASALILYFAGAGKVKPTNNFGAVVDALLKRYPDGRLEDGLDYVRKIFNRLGRSKNGNFGYGKKVNLDPPINYNEIAGNDLKDTSLSLPLRTTN